MPVQSQENSVVLAEVDLDLAAVRFNMPHAALARAFTQPDSPGAIDIQATYYHELVHWLQAISTSWGLLRLRKNFNTRFHVSVGTAALLAKAPDLNVGIPLWRWVNTDGRDTRPPFDNTLYAAVGIAHTLDHFHASLEGRNLPSKALTKQDYALGLAIGLARDAIYPDEGMGKRMLAYWNQCMSEAICEMGDHAWSLEVPGDIEGRPFGAYHLLEGWARLIEFNVLQFHSDRVGSFDELRSRMRARHFDDYRVAYDLFLKHIDPALAKHVFCVEIDILFKVACDIALNAPLHSLHADIMTAKPHRWKQLHPGFRFGAVIAAINEYGAEKLIADCFSIASDKAGFRRGVQVNQQHLNVIVAETQRRICDVLTWPSPSDIAQHVVTMCAGATEKELEEAGYDEILLQYIEACKLRISDPGYVVQPFLKGYFEHTTRRLRIPFFITQDGLEASYPRTLADRDGSIFWNPDRQTTLLRLVGYNDFVHQVTFSDAPIDIRKLFPSLGANWAQLMRDNLAEIGRTETSDRWAESLDKMKRFLDSMEKERIRHAQEREANLTECLRFMYNTCLGINYDKVYYLS